MAQDVAPRLVRLNPASRGGQVGEQGLQGGQWEASHNSCPHQEELGERVEVTRVGLSHRLGWGCLGWARSRGLALEKGRKRHKCDMLRQKNQQDLTRDRMWEVWKREENSGFGSWWMRTPSSETGTQENKESRFESVESEGRAGQPL